MAFGFLVFEADTMFEFGFFISLTLIHCIVIYVLFIWQLDNTLKFVESCEGFIEKSK